MNKIMMFVLLLSLWAVNPVHGGEVHEENSGVTLRLVLEKELGEGPFTLDFELSYENTGSSTQNLSYGSIGLGWAPAEHFYFSLGLGAGEVGLPISVVSPLLLLKGKSEFTFFNQDFFTEVEMEYFPLLVKKSTRFEFLFNHPDLEEFFLGFNIVEKDFTWFQIGPEIKFPLFSIGQIKASDAFRIDKNQIFQDARIVLERKF